MVDHIGLAGHGDCSHNSTASAQRNGSAVCAMCVGIEPKIGDRLPGCLVATANQKRWFLKMPSNGSLALEPRVVVGPGGSEADAKDQVVVQDDVYRKVQIALGDHLDGTQAQVDGIIIAKHAEVDSSELLELFDGEVRQIGHQHDGNWRRTRLTSSFGS